MSHATRRLPIVILVDPRAVHRGLRTDRAECVSVDRGAVACAVRGRDGLASQPRPPRSAPRSPPSASAAAVSCDLKPQTGQLPSDRLTGIQVLGVPGADIVRFQFSPGSLTPAGPPTGSLDVATPPFTEGASGLPVELQGEKALQVVFRGMSLQNDAGEETYTGEREIRATDPSRSLRHVVLFDESEGQLGW